MRNEATFSPQKYKATASRMFARNSSNVEASVTTGALIPSSTEKRRDQ